MNKVKLKNGLTVIIDKKKSDSVVIQVNVKVGSNYENKKNLGISHFVEHMLFNGTKKREERKITQEIEAMGGEINAATSNERTYYYVVVLKKYFEKGLDVLADIIQNPLFEKKDIEKERTVILSEMEIHNDDPNTYQWILFLKNLYKNHPTRHIGFGTRKTIMKTNRNDLIKFHKKYYIPNNITVTIVGDVKNVVKEVEKVFKSFKPKKVSELKHLEEPKQKKTEKIIEKKNTEHSYLVAGYKTVNRNNKDSYVFDIINFILGYGQSSRLFNEIRTKRGLGYAVGVMDDMSQDYGYFAVFVTTSKKNLKKVEKIVINEFKLPGLTNQEVKQAKNAIEGNLLLRTENNFEKADWISFWDLVEDYNKIKDYIKNIKRVTKKDVLRVIKKYFTKNYVEVILEEK